LSAPADVSLFPPNNPLVGVELPRGFPAAAPPNRDGELEAEVVAGFAPKRGAPVFPPDWLLCPPNRFPPACAPPGAGAFCPKSVLPDCAFPLFWLFWLNRLGPGGAPAGVVEGRKDILVGAGVAAGVDAAVHC
jgi:hypothetical protein